MRADDALGADGRDETCAIVCQWVCIGAEAIMAVERRRTMEMLTTKRHGLGVVASLALAAGCFGGGGAAMGGAGNGGRGAGTGGIMGAGSGVLGGRGGMNAVGGAGGAAGTGALCNLPCPGAACAPGYEPYVPDGSCCAMGCMPVGERDPNLRGLECPTVECDGTPFYDANGCRVCSDASACEGVATCVPNSDCGGIPCCDEQGNYFACHCGNATCQLSLRCPDGFDYGCAAPTQGAESPVPPPPVCGCKPDHCPAGQALITNAEIGTWPDGSRRGSFTCSDTLPP